MAMHDRPLRRMPASAAYRAFSAAELARPAPQCRNRAAERRVRRSARLDRFHDRSGRPARVTLRNVTKAISARSAAVMGGQRGSDGVVSGDTDLGDLRQVIEGLTGASLDGHTEPVEGPGWPQPRSYPV